MITVSRPDSPPVELGEDLRTAAWFAAELGYTVSHNDVLSTGRKIQTVGGCKKVDLINWMQAESVRRYVMPAQPSRPDAGSWLTSRQSVWEAVDALPSDGWIHATYRRVGPSEDLGRYPDEFIRRDFMGELFRPAVLELGMTLLQALGTASGGHCGDNDAAWGRYGLDNSLRYGMWRNVTFTPSPGFGVLSEQYVVVGTSYSRSPYLEEIVLHR